MALQKKVGLNYELGIPGQQVVVGQAEYLAWNPLSDGTAKAGAFAFGVAGSGNGEAFGHASLTGAEGAAPLGLVERVVDATINDIAAEAAEAYPAGHPLTVAIRGQFYAVAPAAVTADGLRVCVNPETGAISIAAAAADGEVDTGWVCRVPNGAASAAQGDIVIFERF